MKKYLIFFVLTLSLFANTSKAQTIDIRIPDTTGIKGNLIDIPVYVVNSLTGLDVLSYQLKLNCNTRYLSLKGIITAATMSAGITDPTYKVNKYGDILISAAYSVPLQGNGILLYLRFQMNLSANVQILFSGNNTCFLNQGIPSLNLQGGSVLVDDPIVSSITANFNNLAPLTIGENVQINVSGGTQPYTYQVINSNVGSISSNGLFTGIGIGKTKVIVTSFDGLVDTSDSFIEVRAIKVTLPDTSIVLDRNFIFPIYINSNNLTNILSGSFKINFNNFNIIPDSIILGNTLLQNAFVYSKINNGTITISFAMSAALSGSGELLKIRFKILKTNLNSISLQNVLFNQNLLANTTVGNIQIIDNTNTGLPLSINQTLTEYYCNQTDQFIASGGNGSYTFFVSDTSKADITSSGFFTAKKGGMVKVKVKDSTNSIAQTSNIMIYDAFLDLPSTNVSYDSSFDFPISLLNVSSSKPVFSMQISLGVNDNKFASLEAILTNSLINTWTIAQKRTLNKITISIAGTTPINANGIVIKLRGLLNNTLNIGDFVDINLLSVIFNQADYYTKNKNGRITIVNASCPLQLNAFLEGLYIGNSKMTPSLFNADGISSLTIADTILLELHESIAPFNSVYSVNTLINTNGIIDISLPLNLIGNSYYIVLKHRNSIETWSAAPLVINSSNNYDFTSTINSSFGDNLKDDGNGVFLIYTGDIIQDGAIDFNDYPALDISSSNGDLGYLATDLNGDASTDFNDYPLIDINSSLGIIKLTP
ncbi:MAG: hypothetical protein EBZ58_01970 [Bacteroidetes bacterium]|nr:hypothetical protein [Bacteroidota bacterium]